MKYHKLFYYTILFFAFSSLCFAQNQENPSYFKAAHSKTEQRESLMKGIEKSNDIINKASYKTRLSWDVFSLDQQMKEDRKVIKTLREILSSKMRIDYRNLQLYKNILEEIKDKNTSYKETLNKNLTIFNKNKDALLSISQDPDIQKIISWVDSTKNLKRNPLKRLNSQWLKIFNENQQGLDSLNRWKRRASMNQWNSEELLRLSDSLIFANKFQMAQENTNKYNPKFKKISPGEFRKEFNRYTQQSKKIMNFYFERNASKIFWFPLLISFLMFLWIRRNIKSIEKINPKSYNLEYFPFLKFGWIIAPALIIFSCIHLIDINAPWIYLFTLQIIIALMTAYIIFKSCSRQFFFYFVTVVVTSGIIYAFGETRPSSFLKYAMIFLNILNIFLAYLLIKNVKNFYQLQTFIKVVSIILIFFSFVGVLLGIFNKQTLSQMFANACIIGMMQIICLSFFKQVITEIFVLQLITTRSKMGMLKNYNNNNVNSELNLPLLILIIILWTSLFTANLNIYGDLYFIFEKIAISPIKIGSATFSISGILLFFIIIWGANLLQRYISYFFGDIDLDEDEDYKKQRSRMLISKILVLCVGYVLAIAASGLPLEKITIVLGALSVGIGMGLQSIVNNFISGIILIFDKPLQLGDTIEVKGYNGKVKEMGIRTSTLLTEDGAEVIIPNGDLLSNSIVNWTLTNNRKRIDLNFSLNTDKSKEEITSLISETLKDIDFVTDNQLTSIIFETIKESEMTIKIYFWSTNINKIEWIKSEVRFILYKKFRENNILIL